MQTQIKNPKEIIFMRESGKILATILNYLTTTIEPSMTTKEIANLASQELNVLGGKPAFLGYQGFPDVICISINDEVVHGIPSQSRIIEEGDIVGLDFGVSLNGMITDSARTIIVGRAKSTKHTELVEATKRSLDSGIAVIKNNIRTGDIGAAIQNSLNEKKYGIVRDLVGHGVGHHLHEDPNIPNYGRAHSGPWLAKGMTIAIEPMVTLGSERVEVLKDGWTIRTIDHSLSAHFEHTVLITEEGSEILTAI